MSHGSIGQTRPRCTRQRGSRPHRRPPRPARTRSVEPQRGAVRTTLGQAEPEVDDELAEEATTAEQAVPWLIGVILLLAGMVIVLLALIFAGDASLGGGAGASPTPSALAFVPVPPERRAPLRGPVRRPPRSHRRAPTAVPQYGDLEMIYQGRSAALAPIYLLLRDFSVEGDPEVIGPGPESSTFGASPGRPDGTRGASLYADVLVAIDPRVDVHRLSDGISAITFGNDPETVYAVRVVADGGNDVASVLAVNQATGEERELDRVSYPRPAIEEEASLAEAQFADDGGSVRLFWMHDDTLRLWILGAGTWTVDPAEGNASKLDEEALPVLWAPEGERRIRLARRWRQDEDARRRPIRRSRSPRPPSPAGSATCAGRPAVTRSCSRSVGRPPAAASCRTSTSGTSTTRHR